MHSAYCKITPYQGYNARKVISEVYTSFVLGGKVRRMSTPEMGSIFHKKINKYSVHKKVLCELSTLSKLDAFNLFGN